MLLTFISLLLWAAILAALPLSLTQSSPHCLHDCLLLQRSSFAPHFPTLVSSPSVSSLSTQTDRLNIKRKKREQFPLPEKKQKNKKACREREKRQQKIATLCDVVSLRAPVVYSASHFSSHHALARWFRKRARNSEWRTTFLFIVLFSSLQRQRRAKVGGCRGFYDLRRQ